MSKNIAKKKARIKWDSDTEFTISSLNFRKKLELSHIKKQVEVLATFLPDMILNLNNSEVSVPETFSGVLLRIEIYGFNVLVEKYNKTASAGIHKMTNTVNAIMGAIMEVIYNFGGDALHFYNDGFMVVWNVDVGSCLYEMIHHVIVCACFIRDNFGSFPTEVNMSLMLKLHISCGTLALTIVGNENYKNYCLIGYAVSEVPPNSEDITEDVVVLAPSALGHISEDCYIFKRLDKMHVIVEKYLYHPKRKSTKIDYESKLRLVQELSQKHIEHREILQKPRKFDDTSTDIKLTERFTQSLPLRQSVKCSTYFWRTDELKQFVIKPIAFKVEEKLSVDYLIENREVTLLYFTVAVNDLHFAQMVRYTNEIYVIICSCISLYMGHMIGICIREDKITVLTEFTFKGIKHDLECRHALKAGYKIIQKLKNISQTKEVSASVTIGFSYVSLIGHWYRREYVIIGESYTRACQLTKLFPGLLSCDSHTYNNSKLSSSYFTILRTTEINTYGTIYGYSEEIRTEHIYALDKPNVIYGRDDLLQNISFLVNNPTKIGNRHGMCFKGPDNIGITALLQTAASLYKEDGHTVAYIELLNIRQRAYFTVSMLYNQIYEQYAAEDSDHVDVIKDLPRDLWDFNVVLQKDAKLNPTVYTERKFKILDVFLKICKGDDKSTKDNLFTILFIDNVQHIDKSSFDLLQGAMEQKACKVVCGGTFDQAHVDILWKFSILNEVKVLDVLPITEEIIPSILCQIMKVKAVPKTLVSLILKTCEGRPGYIQKTIVRLLNTNCITIEFLHRWKIERQMDNIIPDNKTDDISNDEDNKSLIISVAIFNEVAPIWGHLSVDNITYEEYTSFTEYQQLVIKTAAVLGETFSRTLLMVALRYPSDHLLASSIKKLFEENIFDCATKYINLGSVNKKHLVCQCMDFQTNKEMFGFPKYSFCNFIYFKNNYLRIFSLKLLPIHHRKELHLKCTDILENQDMLCPVCAKDNTEPMIKLRTFSQVSKVFKKLKTRQPMSQENETNDEFITSEEVKNIIRATVQKSIHNTEFSEKVRRKIWDPTICKCLEIHTRVYSDLVFHSKSADHLGKTIVNLINYSMILLMMNEVEDTIPLLAEASELCLFNSKFIILTEEFKKMCLGNIHRILAECHLILGNVSIAKNHLMISLRQYDIPMISMIYGLPNKLLHRKCITKNHTLTMKEKNTELMVLTKADIAACLNIASMVFACEGKYELAKLSALRSLVVYKHSNDKVELLMDIYCNIVDIYSFGGDNHICESLEKNIHREIFQHFSSSTRELFRLCKLLFSLFQSNTIFGNLDKSIRLGYRTLELNLLLQYYVNLVDILPLLCSLLLMKQRIEDSVQVSKLLCKYSIYFDSKIEISYFAFCLEVCLETGFYLVPLEKILNYADNYYMVQGNRVSTNYDNKLILLLCNHYLRNGQVGKVDEFLQIYNNQAEYKFSYISVTNTLKYLENILIYMILDIEFQFSGKKMREDKAKNIFKECSKMAEKYNILKPRFLHLKAYYTKVKLKKPQSAVLNEAMKIAKQQGNILEQSWITLNKTNWKYGIKRTLDVKYYNWQYAREYSPLHWSQIMYPLPSI